MDRESVSWTIQNRPVGKDARDSAYDHIDDIDRKNGDENSSLGVNNFRDSTPQTEDISLSSNIFSESKKQTLVCF